MVELDEAVMRVVREHMPSVAGGVLDCYKGENSKVLKTTHHMAICFLQELLETIVSSLGDCGRCYKVP